jgi:hypothetical protein
MSSDEINDFTYIRPGYISQDRHCDTLVSAFTGIVPGDSVLPPRWKYTTQEAFVAEFGKQGLCLWAKAMNSHLLLIAGVKVLRIWTDTHKHCYVDIRDNLSGSVSAEPIPAGNVRKCKPFTQRTKVTNIEDMKKLALETKRIHGI